MCRTDSRQRNATVTFEFVFVETLPWQRVRGWLPFQKIPNVGSPLHSETHWWQKNSLLLLLFLSCLTNDERFFQTNFKNTIVEYTMESKCERLLVFNLNPKHCYSVIVLKISLNDLAPFFCAIFLWKCKCGDEMLGMVRRFRFSSEMEEKWILFRLDLQFIRGAWSLSTTITSSARKPVDRIEPVARTLVFKQAKRVVSQHVWAECGPEAQGNLQIRSAMDTVQHELVRPTRQTFQVPLF